MKVLVLGAGVVGATTAYFLTRDGHAVTVVDRQSAPGQETSFANAAQISACAAKPLAGPGIPWQSFKWMFQKDSPLLLKPFRWDPALWTWGMRFLANCTAGRARTNIERSFRVALYSRTVLQSLRQFTNIQYDQVLQGILHIYRTQDEFIAGQANAAVLKSLGLTQDILTPAECVKLEPALDHAARDKLVGGLFSAGDESGDARKFTAEIARLAEAQGAIFRFGETVERMDHDAHRVTRIMTDKGEYTPDAIVMALGSFSPLLARDLDLALPVYPSKGYSITVDIEKPKAAPTVSITDASRYMVFSRLGTRLRVAGTVELSGLNTYLDPVRVAPLIANARELFPDASRYEDVNPWCGLRPSTPDSVPIIGPTKYQNFFVNTGHGMLGWTMACGSGRVIADLISGRSPEIDLSGLTLDRYS